MSVLGALLRRVMRIIPANAVVRVIAGPLRGMRWVAGSAPHGAWLGRIESETLAHFARHVRPGSIVWDVGANVGLYALAAARAAGPSGHVVAFEPESRNVDMLKRHLALNRIENVTVVQAAVAREAGTVRMSAGASASEFHVDPAGDIVMPAVSLDGWRRSNDAATPTTIKIDVEGAEVDVLEGAANVIRMARPVIYLAVHGEDKATRCHQLLVTAGYRLTTARNERWPFDAAEWIALP